MDARVVVGGAVQLWSEEGMTGARVSQLADGPDVMFCHGLGRSSQLPGWQKTHMTLPRASSRAGCHRSATPSSHRGVDGGDVYLGEGFHWPRRWTQHLGSGCLTNRRLSVC